MFSRLRLRAAVLLPLLALLAGCTGGGGPAVVQSSAPPADEPRSSPTAALPKVDHVVVIVEENKSASHIYGSADAPFLNELARTGAAALDYSAIRNPSLPNYIALTSGTTAGITSDCQPQECPADVRHIGDTLEAAGRTWKMYGESMPEPCSSSTTDRYAVKHIPFLYFPNVLEDENRCAAHVVPFTQLQADLDSGSLPDFSFITPDMCNDMHDCAVATGDAWLAQQVPAILRSSAFSQNSLLVVTFDEGNSSDNTIAAVFAGPAARSGYQSRTAYDHYSLLHTIEALWSLPTLTENDAGAAIMRDMLRTSRAR